MYERTSHNLGVPIAGRGLPRLSRKPAVILRAVLSTPPPLSSQTENPFYDDLPLCIARAAVKKTPKTAGVLLNYSHSHLIVSPSFFIRVVVDA